MKQAYFEDEGSCGVCPILEEVDLDAMTDEQLQEELSNWRAGGDDDPFAWEIDGNYRLVERHIELRGMSDEALAAGVEEADSTIKRWTSKLDGEDAWLARRIIRTHEGDAKDYRRELARRAGPVEVVEDDVADAEEEADVIVTPEGIFLFPDRVPADMPHDERTEEEMRLWWGRPFITENDGPEKHYYVQCLDGGAWDRPTLRGCSHSVDGALSIARSLLA